MSHLTSAFRWKKGNFVNATEFGLRPASSSRLAGGVVCEEGRGRIRRCFLARREPFFLHRLHIFICSNGILRKTVLFPPLNRMNVTTVNKDLCCLVLTIYGGL